MSFNLVGSAIPWLSHGRNTRRCSMATDALPWSREPSYPLTHGSPMAACCLEGAKGAVGRTHRGFAGARRSTGCPMDVAQTI